MNSLLGRIGGKRQLAKHIVCEIPEHQIYAEVYTGEPTFSAEDHALLADILKRIKGKFLISYNNVPEIRELYSGYNIQEVKTKYSISSQGHQDVREILVKNY
ncbi:MAG: hypothetical protein D6712_17880 [Chloroflexi bacterium]|nr:MAG: hypothetical protein D6712_17880 [Chloroflexota bacterium]